LYFGLMIWLFALQHIYVEIKGSSECVCNYPRLL
jgi:hypothetical protein